MVRECLSASTKKKCKPRGNVGESIPGKGQSWCKGPEVGRCFYVGGTEGGELTELSSMAHKGFSDYTPVVEDFRRAVTI